MFSSELPLEHYVTLKWRINLIITRYSNVNLRTIKHIHPAIYVTYNSAIPYSKIYFCDPPPPENEKRFLNREHWCKIDFPRCHCIGGNINLKDIFKDIQLSIPITNYQTLLGSKCNTMKTFYHLFCCTWRNYDMSKIQKQQCSMKFMWHFSAKIFKGFGQHIDVHVEIITK